MKSKLRLLRALISDYEILLPEASGLDRDFETIKERLEHEGVGFLTCALPAFGKSFDLGLSLGRMVSPLGFSKRGPLPKFLSGLVYHVFDSSTGLLLEEPSVEYIRCIREICYFFKKFIPSDSRKSVLERQAFLDFKAVEDEISDDKLDLSFLTDIARLILPNLDVWDVLDGRNGPGSVLEGFSPNQKWVEIYRHAVRQNDLLTYFGFDLFGSSEIDLAVLGEALSDASRLSPAKLVTVPKSSTALRTISVESCIAQFSQQILNLHLRQEIEKCSILSQCLSLNSQVPNQKLALESSRTGDWVTVDLSSASDRLSLQVVEAVFQFRPRFLRGLLMSRTPSVKYPKGEIMLKKYAGMGNATTFPVQSICFALIAIGSILGGQRRSLRNCVRAAQKVRVFGDDIIIHKDCFQVFSSRISALGLKINQEKTFSEGNFRESCGVDAYAGVDVTPIYLRTDPSLSLRSASDFESTVSTSNQLWLVGRYRLSEYLRSCVEGKNNQILPCVRRDSSALGWHSRQDVSTIQRWNRRYHRFEFRSVVSIPLRKRDPLDGRAALLKYFMHPLVGRDDNTHLEYSVRRFSNRLRSRWVPS